MISVEEAFQHILAHTIPVSVESVPLSEAAGRILREDITADRDLPPFDRVTMDGIAVRYEAFAAGQRRFRINGMQLAGQPPRTLADPAACLEAMTGAVLPFGTDTIIRYEDLTLTDGWATVNLDVVTPGQNVHRRASDRPQGDRLIGAGTRLNPVHIAVAASVGKGQVLVSARPRIALISTGDELVDVDETPLPHQIRRSNTYLLKAVLDAAGAQTTLLHLPDEEAVMEENLSHWLTQFDALVLSGGVSAGKADFVPRVLERLGVRAVFHQVAQRPGKPLWFGCGWMPGWMPSLRAMASIQASIHIQTPPPLPTPATPALPVFGLPGNPVSTFLCACRYLLPWLSASLGEIRKPPSVARLMAPVAFKPSLTYFLPVGLTVDAEGVWLAEPFPGGGSGDYANLLRCDGFLELPADRSEFAADEAFPVWTW